VPGPASTDIVLFGEFRLDRRRGVLSRKDEKGAFAPVAAGSRALEILGVLVERPGELVSRGEIIAAVWAGTAVEDSNLNVQVAALRRILDKERTEESHIQTVSGRGYRFTAPVTRIAADAAPPPSRLPSLPDTPSLAVMPFHNMGGDPARPSRRGWAIAGAAATLMLVIMGLAWWFLPAWRAVKPTDHAPAAAAISPPIVAPRLSIVVLPFADLSRDPGQQYLADGVTEDLTTDLSRIEHILVISRNSAFTYRDKPVNAKQVGRELGVRYLLEGSVERSGNKIRVNAQLVDAETDAHLWAERFDRDLGDLFAIQNEITARIAITLNFRLAAAEAARPTERPDAVEYILRGQAAFIKGGFSHKTYAEAIGWFERALALEPRSVEAQAWLAEGLTIGLIGGSSDDSASDIARAEKLIADALAVSPDYRRAHIAKSMLRRAQGRPEESAAESETVLASDPNSVNALINLSWCKAMTGSLDEAIPLAEQAIRLSPRDPFLAGFYGRIGWLHLLQLRTGNAVLWLERARSIDPRSVQARSFLAAAYALEGETERAAAELAAVRRLSGNDTYSSLAHLRAAGFSGSGYWGVPKVRALFEAVYFAGLRKAGMPEE
jgi:TolB-like protein/cytochrome c-type biogenesis protein CcmH/NrfG